MIIHPGRRPTQTSHPGGLEVHIKADYRVAEASAKLSRADTPLIISDLHALTPPMGKAKSPKRLFYTKTPLRHSLLSLP